MLDVGVVVRGWVRKGVSWLAWGKAADGAHGGVVCFASRRRHTGFDCDWSSAVCSSDLLSNAQAAALAATLPQPRTSNPAFRPARMLARRDLILARYYGGKTPVPPAEEDSIPVIPPIEPPVLPVIPLDSVIRVDSLPHADSLIHQP